MCHRADPDERDLGDGRTVRRTHAQRLTVRDRGGESGGDTRARAAGEAGRGVQLVVALVRRAGAVAAAGVQYPTVGQQQGRRVVQAVDLVARQRGPGAGRGTPKLGGVHDTGEVVEAGRAAAARHEYVAGRQNSGVQLPAGVRHRARVPPRRTRVVQIDDLSRVRRRIVAADVKDLAGPVHHGRAITPPPRVQAARAVAPLPRARDVEPARRLFLAGVEHPPVRSHEVSWVVFQPEARRRELAPARPIPDLGDRDDRPVLVRAGDREPAGAVYATVRYGRLLVTGSSLLLKVR